MSTETEVKDRLSRAVTTRAFAPLDAAPMIRAGSRARRRRTFSRTLTAAGALTVAAIATSYLVAPGDQPPPFFGDPGERHAAIASGGAQDGYPDLVVRRVGGRWVTISGFGWPIEGQEVVSDSAGNVEFPEIDRRDAETMCLPMLNQAAPQVPDSRWHHSEAWIDGFPTRAGLVSTFGAEYQGRTYHASCTLPGDYTPADRPDLDRVPGVQEPRRILAHCSYLGHVDMSAWRVAATAGLEGTVAAALAAPDGTLARCVLSPDIAQRLVQLTRLGAAGPVIYSQRRGLVTVVGQTDPVVERLVVRTEDTSHPVAVVDGVFAAVIRSAQEPTSVAAYDAAGNAVDINSAPVPDECFTSSRPRTTAADPTGWRTCRDPVIGRAR